MISIELISKGETTLRNTLDSIVGQNFGDYELICADSSGDQQTEDILKSYDCKFIRLPSDTGHLSARYEAHKRSKGEMSLMLDSTRPLRGDALRILYEDYRRYDMVIIREDSIGEGYWSEQAKLLKITSEAQFERIKEKSVAFLLPRFYNSSLLTRSFLKIVKDTGDLFSRISYGEHHLIFETCLGISKNVALTEDALVYHYEDTSIRKILAKYYRYGRDQKIFKLLRTSEVSKFGPHHREGIGVTDRIKLLPITVARGVPFILGYIF